jgi:hexosaminidase
MRQRILIGSIALVAAGIVIAAIIVLPQLGSRPSASTAVSIIPAPRHLQPGDGAGFDLTGAGVHVTDESLAPVADFLADTLSLHGDEGIELELDSELEAEAYRLDVGSDGIRIAAGSAAGAFWAVQSLRQLVPVDSAVVPAVEIRDAPRFAYRGAMLDVTRHFFGVDDVKRYIDDIALLKLNHLHLHLSDDQGWRLQIDSWPLLTEVGSRYEVGTAPGQVGGGFYSKADYRELVDYAATRFITIVPEIDMPGHTNAALASYAELNPDGVARTPYTGINVGFSTLDVHNEATWRFVEDVVTEVAELSPGPYLHIGGDESQATSDADFEAFVARASAIAAATGKTVIGWHEMGQSTELAPGTIGQYWSYTTPQTADTAAHAVSFVEQGGKLLMSPADVAYLDMKYDFMTQRGLTWADGFTSIEDAYDWDPAEVLDGVGDEQLLGVEAPLWSETLETIDDIEFMAFPRVAAIAEIGWSQQDDRDLDDFLGRLPAFGTYLEELGIRYNRASGVDWRE